MSDVLASELLRYEIRFGSSSLPHAFISFRRALSQRQRHALCNPGKVALRPSEHREAHDALPEPPRRRLRVGPSPVRGEVDLAGVAGERVGGRSGGGEREGWGEVKVVERRVGEREQDRVRCGLVEDS